MESPQGSPDRSQQQDNGRSTSRLDVCNPRLIHQDEVEAIYQERIRPVKKRRLRGDSQKALLDNQRVKKRVEGARSSRRSRGAYVGEEKKADDRLPQCITNSVSPPSMTAVWNSMLVPETKDANHNTRGVSRDPPAGSIRKTTRNDNHELPLFMSRNLSAVVNERVVDQDVEVFIAGALDKIDLIIDDDEENVIDRSQLKYEL